MSEQSSPPHKPSKKRSLTSVTLGWIADRVRKAQQIKEEIQNGTYNVNTEKVAASIVNREDHSAS